jgi:hypothetical protein
VSDTKEVLKVDTLGSESSKVRVTIGEGEVGILEPDGDEAVEGEALNIGGRAAGESSSLSSLHSGDDGVGELAVNLGAVVVPLVKADEEVMTPVEEDLDAEVVPEAPAVTVT